MTVKCPVCGASIDLGKKQYKTVYKGAVYYFCCLHCKREFERDPSRYVG